MEVLPDAKGDGVSDQTGISWTDSTWNPVTGCTRVSAGCDHCYAVDMTKRLAKYGQPNYIGLVNDGKSHFNGVVRCHDAMLLKPFGWKKPRRVFVNSMSDLFHKDVPFEFIDKVFAVMALCPHLTFQILTKRPERAAEYLNRTDWHEGVITELNSYFGPDDPAIMAVRFPLPNVWLGTSVEDLKAADERIPHLLRCPAAVRFLSCEPLLGQVDIAYSCFNGADSFGSMPGINWVIAGGESGPGRREMRLEWLESIVRQCQAAGVPVFVKQASGARPGMQGGIPDRIWAMKQFPNQNPRPPEGKAGGQMLNHADDSTARQGANPEDGGPNAHGHRH